MENLTKKNRAIFRSRCGLIVSLVFASLTPHVAHALDVQKHDSQAQVQSTSQSGVVNINTATEQELVRLPGIGPSKAQAILKLRAQTGSFTRIENLLRVRGIGHKMLKKLQPMLTLKGETTLVASKVSKGGKKHIEKNVEQ
jgi:comEA protein